MRCVVLVFVGLVLLAAPGCTGGDPSPGSPGSYPDATVDKAGSGTERQPDVRGTLRFVTRDSVSVVEGSALESDTLASVIPEVSMYTLKQPLPVDVLEPDTVDSEHPPGTDTLSAGRVVSSYLLHVDTMGGEKTVLTGSLTLPHPVIAVLATGGGLDRTDSRLGSPTVRYPEAGRGRYRSINVSNSDALTVSADDRTVTVEIHNWDGADQVRILTRGDRSEPTGD